MRTGTNRGPDYGGSGDDGTGTTVGADLVDFRLGRFHGDVVGVQNHFRPGRAGPQTAPSNGWSGWESLGGVITSDITVGRNRDGRMEFFARGTDNAVWHQWRTQA
ncbi:hypothetical protein [Streptomyces phaeofaciens]|uniref:hypothetical protein n=1 Tax=Streptomyces phaeofaciens TaxID=68254 RepID=UPI0036CC69B1